MKPIAKIDCQINGTYYIVGEEIKVEDIEQLKRLNEGGFIEPLTQKQIQEYFKKPMANKFNIEKEEK